MVCVYNMWGWGWVCLWQCVLADCCIESTLSLPLPIFIHADDVVWWHRLESRESAESFLLLLLSSLLFDLEQPNLARYTSGVVDEKIHM